MPVTSPNDEPEPKWQDNAQTNGKLFYLELSEGEEEAALVQSTLPRISGGKRRESRNRGATREDSMPCVSPDKTHLKTVSVYLNPKRLGGSAALPLLESLLGVLRLPRHPDAASVGREARLTVDGLIPGSPASKCGRVLIGDVLVAVDDVEVSAENIEQVLAAVLGPTQVRLTLATPTNPGRPATASVPAVPPARPLPGEDASRPETAVAGVPHSIMYLSLQMDAESPRDEVHPEEEILYQYPASEAAARLKGARGIFMTLCDMMDSVTGGHVVSSTLLLPDNHLVHVGYWKEDDALLLVGLPAERVPLPCLQTLVGDAVRTLRVMYGSLARAFGRTEHRPQLDGFFRLFFLRLTRPSDSPLAPPTDTRGNIFLDGLPAVRWLALPLPVKTDVDSVLTDLEASDFGEMSEDFFGLRRLYGILGSCLFYKSHLIANHLPQEDLLDACLYMRHHDPPPPATSRRGVGQPLVWREVFLRGSRPARHFLLIVALRCWRLCVLLEAGGRAAHYEARLGPDRVYVDQVTAALLRLETLEEAVEEGLGAPAAARSSCADWFPQASPNGPGREKARDRGGEVYADASGSPAKILAGRRDSADAGGGIFKIQRTKPSTAFHLGPLMKTRRRRDPDQMSTKFAERRPVPLRAGGNGPGNLHRAHAGGGGSARRIHAPPVPDRQLLPLLPVHSGAVQREHAGTGPSVGREAWWGREPRQRARSPVPACTRKRDQLEESRFHPDLLGHRAVAAGARPPGGLRVLSRLAAAGPRGDGLQALLRFGRVTSRPDPKNFVAQIGSRADGFGIGRHRTVCF
ncbi:protein inturned isoform X2 [Hippocampus zosterae]|uniref:protein inturned isoform X2 n=1 Tax=Hippocampus zosterae TaxID=109293 RepID=UPI00223D5897|nr:protein inturned isoform X2 [Hippocampus zosterae]